MSDMARKLRSVRADMLGTDDEQHFHDCHNAAAHVEELEADNARLQGNNRVLLAENNRLRDELSEAKCVLVERERYHKRLRETLNEIRDCDHDYSCPDCKLIAIDALEGE